MTFFALRSLALRDALRIIGHGWRVFLLSTVLAALALTLPAAVGLLALQLAPLAQRAQLAPQATVFLSLAATRPQVQELQRQIEHSAEVATVRAVPRDVALAQLRQRAGAEALPLAINPLPDALIVSFAAGAKPQAIEGAIAALQALPQVDLVQADIGWYRKLMTLARSGLLLGTALGGLSLSLLALTLVGAIRLLTVASTAEIRTLRLLGASERLIRRPLIYVAMASMLLAVALAAALLFGLATLTEPQLMELASEYNVSLQWRFPSAQWLSIGVAGILFADFLLASLAAQAAVRSLR